MLPTFDLAHVGAFDLSAVTQLFLRDPNSVLKSRTTAPKARAAAGSNVFDPRGLPGFSSFSIAKRMALGYDKNHVKFNSLSKFHETSSNTNNFDRFDGVRHWR